MNKSFSQAIQLAKEIVESKFDDSVQLIVIPPSIYASEISKIVATTNIRVGAQNSSEYEFGAYTGEISADMFQSVGVSFVLVGHSERRSYFNEQNEVLTLKVNQLLRTKITPIYCCGETLEEREAENHFNLIKKQLDEGLFHLDGNQIGQCVIAYEPVWAIGTGVTASADQAQEMHEFIRNLLNDKYGMHVGKTISLLYGGSCNPGNSKELFAKPDIDGGLIGGASLNLTDFIAIANSF